MTVTRLDICTQAYRRIGVNAIGETLPANEFTYADAMLGALYEELSLITPLPFTLDDIPTEYLIPLGNLLAVELGPSFGVGVEAKGKPLSRFMAIVRPDDREYTDPTPPEYF